MLKIAGLKKPTPPGPPDPTQGPDPKALMAALAGGGGPQGSPSDGGPDPDQDPSQEPDQDGDEGNSPQKIDQKTVVYMTSDLGPFRCDNCCFYQDPNGCSMVDGKIDPGGCCNIYCPPNHEAGPPDSEPDAGSPDDQGAGPDAGDDSGAPPVGLK